MKVLYITFAFCILSIASFAQGQTCKIKIYYDNNGNRIQRIQECTPPKPARQDSTTTIVPAEASDMVYGSESDFVVYPNPAEDKVNVKLDANSLIQECSITLTDITGRVLFQKQNVKDALTTISLGGCADATYYIILLRGQVRNTVKIVRQAGNLQ